jgi:hypothetical protein
VNLTQGPLTTTPFTAWAPFCLSFSENPGWPFPSPWMPLMVVLPPRHYGRCPQAPWLAIIPCFQVPRVAQSLIVPLSRWHLATALWDMGSDNMNLFSNAGLPHRRSHCHTKFPYYLRLVRTVGYPVDRTASLFYQSFLAHLVTVTSGKTYDYYSWFLINYFVIFYFIFSLFYIRFGNTHVEFLWLLLKF